MTTPLWCLLIAVLMPYVLAFSGAGFRQRQLGSVDNRNPRQQALQLTGAGARCYAAQQNAWEALAVFTAAVTAAHLAGAAADTSALAAQAFIAARVVHAGCRTVLGPRTAGALSVGEFIGDASTPDRPACDVTQLP
jgi:uncharacterized MAPEG superfamily protein